MLTYMSRSEAETRALGLRLGALLPEGSVVALNGPLGAGKTRLVQAIAEARGHDPREVVSPTFTLIQEYRGPKAVYHFDVYRIADDDEFLNLGPDEYFSAGGVTIIEWAEKVARCLPPARLEICMSPVDAATREIKLFSQGREYDAVLAEFAREA